MTASSLLFGLLFAVLIGGVAVGFSLWAIRNRSASRRMTTSRGCPAGSPGAWSARSVTVLFAYGSSGTGTAMIGWLTLKFIINWNHARWQSGDNRNIRGLAFSALLAGLISMLFAAIGGRIASGEFIW